MGFEDLGRYEQVPVPAPDIMQPEAKRVWTLERAVGHQISRLEEMADANPLGGAQLGFILRSHARTLYMAIPVPERFRASGLIAAWKPNWFEPQMIVTRSMERLVTFERAGESFTANPLYRRLEGEWIKGARFLDEANPWGGETIEFELGGEMRLRLQALPGRAHGLASVFSANYKLELRLPPPRTVIRLGSDDPLIVRPTFIGRG